MRVLLVLIVVGIVLTVAGVLMFDVDGNKMTMTFDGAKVQQAADKAADSIEEAGDRLKESVNHGDADNDGVSNQADPAPVDQDSPQPVAP